MATIANAMMPQGQRESCQSASVRTGSAASPFMNLIMMKKSYC